MAIRAYSSRNRRNTLQRPRKDLYLFTFVGCYSLRIASIDFVEMVSLPGFITIFQYSMVPTKKNHFFIFSDRPSLDHRPRSGFIWSKSSSTDLEKMEISYEYTRANCHFIVDSMMPITIWNVLGAFFRRSCNPRNLYSLWCDITVIVSLLQSSISICRGPQLDFSPKSMRVSSKKWRHSLNLGIWYESLAIMALASWSRYRTIAGCHI